MKQCAQCETTRFGLIRYSRGMKQFCSTKCLTRYEAELNDKLGAARRRWLTFLARGGPRST
jgi:hypothetical protein